MILREIGADGMRERVVRHDDCFRLRPAGWMDEARLDVLNEDVLHGIRARGRAVTSRTRVDGRFAIRPCFVDPRTTLADVDALVDEVLTVGRELTAGA